MRRIYLDAAIYLLEATGLSSHGLIPDVPCIPVGFAAAQGTGAHHHQQEDGTYRFAGLLPGRYGLTAELPGFAINKKQFKFR